MAQGDVERASDEPRVPGEKEARPPGKRENPLAHGHGARRRQRPITARHTGSVAGVVGSNRQRGRAMHLARRGRSVI